MEGIGLDSMLGAEQVEKLFGSQAEPEEQEVASGAEAGGETPAEEENNETTEETAEVDFSDLLGGQPESVGSEREAEGTREAPESNDDSGTPQTNLFTSIARILRDKGVFPDLSDEALDDVKDEVALEKLFDDKVTNMFDERQRNLEKALSSGATTDEMKEYQNALSTMQFLEDRNTLETLSKEGDDAEKLRKQMMYQDYINRGFKHEKAVKMIQQSIDNGSDIEDAKEAYESCKEFYRSKVEDFQQEFEDRKRQQQDVEKKQYDSLKKKILDTDSFYGGVKVDKNMRQKAYDAIIKPVFKDEDGNLLTALQKYQRENPLEFMVNMAMMMTLTDNFKNVEKLTKVKVKENTKKVWNEVASVLNTTKRNNDGTLNLANTGPDDSEREKWTLAV